MGQGQYRNLPDADQVQVHYIGPIFSIRFLGMIDFHLRDEDLEGEIIRNEKDEIYMIL